MSSASLRIAVFTTSYPKDDGDVSGRFIADVVDRVRDRGITVDVVGPQSYNTYGIAGNGVMHSLKRRPWVLPLMLLSMVRAIRAAGKHADLVHTNWLAGAVLSLVARVRFVVTLHGSGTAGKFEDIQLAKRWPWLVRRVLNASRGVICVSNEIADAMRDAGVRNVHVIPNGIDVPTSVHSQDDPPFVLYAGRLSPEKGIHELDAATTGLNRVIAGDGPLRDLVPDTLGFVARKELFELYGRCTVVIAPSRREGASVVIAEAMAHGRPVVATRVGGIPTFVEHGETGFLVDEGDIAGLREHVELLLSDHDLAQRLGDAGRARIERLSSWEPRIDEIVDVYRTAVL